MCSECHVGMVGCIKCGVKTKKSTQISECILNILISASSDLGFEYGWQPKNSEHLEGWLEKALISSGVSALCMTFFSSMLEIAHYKLGEATEVERAQQAMPSYTYTAILISEILSGLISFGIGIGMEALIEVSVGHDQLNTWENSGKFVLGAIVPASITVAKTMGRWGIFNLTNYVIDKVCWHDKENSELLPLAQNRIKL